MNRPKHLRPILPSARPGHDCGQPAGSALAAAVMLVLGIAALPVYAQSQAVPEFTVPVLEDVDPSTVTFDGSIIERDRSQGGVSLPGAGNPGNPNSSGNGGRSGNGVPGASGSGTSAGGGPSIFSGGPAGSGSRSSTSMPGSPSGNGNQGVDVNVSVNGIPADGSISIPSLPGADTGNSGDNGPSSADGGGNNDGGLEVNVDIAGGKQLPTLNIPGMPGMPGMPGSSSGSGMPGMPGSSNGSGMPGMPGSSSGSGGMPGMPGSSSGSGSSGNGRQGTASGNGSPGSGSSNGNGRSVAGTSGNSSSPGMGSGNGTGSGSASGGGGGGQRSVLDRRLEKSFGVFDGMIIGERERAQTDANAAGSSVMGTGGGTDGQGDSGEGGQMPGVIIATGPMDNSSGGGMIPGNANSREGDFSHQAQSYPVPDDIPDGNDDDVVARQLREAAMTEPDPELRKKLWDEYRLYTGLPAAE